MESDQDFSLVMDTSPPQEDTVEGMRRLTDNYKGQYEQLLQEQKELKSCRDERQEMSRQFRLRTEKVEENMRSDRSLHQQKMDSEKAKLELVKLEVTELEKQILQVEEDLQREEEENQQLKEQTDVFSAVPEKKVVFKGETEKPSEAEMFDMKTKVIFPLEEGTALVTFEDEDVAQKILDLKQHHVVLEGDCRILVEAQPIRLKVPGQVEIHTEVCPQRILVSDLPHMDQETLKLKLEVHFSKSRNGGGEVEECELLPDSGTVVIKFVEKNIAKGLTETEHHEVELQKKQRVRVTPFLNGNVTRFKTRMSVCPRTVLLTGIPDVMEAEVLQDLLEIHFQKTSNGGGEIEAFLYNGPGLKKAAVFE